MDSSYFSPVASFIAGIIGVFLTHHLTRKRKTQDDLISFRLKAYQDFISAAAMIACARRAGETTDELKLLSDLNDAKVRMCIAASENVLIQLQSFWLHGGTLEQESEILSFTRLCHAIRSEIDPTHSKITDVRLSDILFKLTTSNFSAAKSPK